MGGEVFISPSSSGGGGGDTNPRSKRNPTSSLTLAVFLSATLFTLVVILADHCEAQHLHAEHRGDPEGGVPLGDYDDDDGGVVPILSHRNGIQHEDVLTALPNHYFVPNAQYPASPVYQPTNNGSIASASSTSATPEAGTTAASGKDGKDFTPPNDIVRGFKPVYPDDARFVSITTSTVGPPPKRRKKVKRVKGQQQQTQPISPGPYQQQQQQLHPQQQQGFQNSFGFQPTGPGGYFQPHPMGHGGSSGPYFAAANQFYSFTAGNAIDSQNNHTGHVSFPNDTSSGSQAPPSYSTLYSTNPSAPNSQQQGQDQYQQQQAGPYLSSGVPLAGAPGFPPQQFGPHGPPLGPPKVNPLKKLANLIRGRPRPPHPGHPPLPPHGPPLQGIPPYQPSGPYPPNPQQGPPQYPGGPPQGPYPQGQQRHPPYNPALLQQQQHYYQQQQIQQMQQAQAQQQAAQAQQQNVTQNSNSTSSQQATAASNNAPSVSYPTGGNIPGYPGALPGGPHGPGPRPGGGGPPNKNFLSKLNFNTYLKKFSNMFQRGPPPPGTPPGLGVPPGGKTPGAPVGAPNTPHGPPPQQKVPQQILYPHYYPLNSYAPNGPNAQVQAQYQQQLQQQQQQVGTPSANNQIRRRRIKVRKNGVDPRNRKVDDAPEAVDQKELIGRPRLAGQNDDTDDDMDMSPGMNEPSLPEQDENAGGRRRKRLATISSIATSSSSSTSSSTSSSNDPTSHANSGYRMPGIFGMDSGKAFYLDKDPQTGDITFNAPAGSTSGESSAQVGGSTSPSSNELSPDSKYKPIIIHSYSSTKNQGGLSTYKRPNLASLNNKFKAKRPTFYKFNKTSTLAPPRLPSFYVPSTTQFPSTSSTTPPAPTVSAILPESGEETSTSGKPEFPNVIIAKSSSEVITRVSMSSSVTSSKEVVGPQYKKKSPVKFPLFKHTTPSTTTSTAATTTEEARDIITISSTTQEPITTTTQAPPEVETTQTTTTSSPSSTTTTTEPTSTSIFYDPYLPFELLNLQKQALATASTTTTTTTSTTTHPSTTTQEITTTVSTTSTEVPTTVSTTTPDPYTVPEVVVKLETTEQTTTTTTAPSTLGSSSSVIPSSVAPSEATNGSSLLPTGPETEQAEPSQEQEEDEDYYYDNPEPGQGFGMPPGAGGPPGQYNSFGQYRPGGMPPHGIPGGYYNPMMGGGQGRPPVVPPHPNNYYNSFNPFGPPGYYPPGHPNQPQGIQGGGFFNPAELIPSNGIPTSSEPSSSPETTTPAVSSKSTTSSPSTSPSTTTTISTTVSSTTTSTTEPPSPTTTVATTTEIPNTPQSSTVETTTSSTTSPPPSPSQSSVLQDGDLLGEPDVYEEYEDDPEGDVGVPPAHTHQPQHPNSFHLPPPPPQRPQPPIPPHRRPPPPPPFMNRLPPLYFNNQRPPPVRPGGGNFPFRPPPPVKEVMKSVTTTTTTEALPPSTTTVIITTVPPSPTTTKPHTTTTTTTKPPPSPTTTRATTTTSTTTKPPPPPSTPTTQRTTSSTTETSPPPPSQEHHIPSESREAINQDLFIPPEQLLAYTPSPDRVQDQLPDEVIQDIAPGFDLFNVQWGQKVPPPSSTSYSSQEQQPVPVQHLTTTSTTLAPPTTRIISRNVTEVNINGTDYIYEYIDEIIEEEVPLNATTPPQALSPSETPASVLQQQSPQLPPAAATAAGIPPAQQQFYNPYVMNPYNGFVAVSSTPGYGAQGPFLLPNGQPAWIHPQQAGSYDYYLPAGVAPNQFPPQGLDGSQQFIPVGAGFGPSSIAPVQEISPTSPEASTPSAEPDVSASVLSSQGPGEIMAASPSSVHPPLLPVTENSVDISASPSAPPAQDTPQQGDDLSESYIVSLIDPSKQNGTAVSPLGGLGGFISSTTERLPLYSSGADTVEHTNLLISSTSGTAAPALEQVHISSSTSPPVPSTSTTTEKAVSYEYVDYPEGDEVSALPGPQQGSANKQMQNIQSLQMMRPPAPLPPHLQQQQQQQQGHQGLPPHGPPHPQKKKPSSFLQNLFGKLRPGNAPAGPPPPGHHGHIPYPSQGLPPQLNKNSYMGDSLAAGSGPLGVPASAGGAGVPLLPPVMIPSAADQEQFNMDTLFGARNGTVAEDTVPISTMASSPPTSPAPITTPTTKASQSAMSAELGSDEEDEVIYVTPEELAKLKETGQVDDFELVEDEEEYEYEDEPLNDITNNKLARSDTKFGATLGQNDTSEQSSTLLKKTAPIAPPVPITVPTTTPSSTTTTQPPPSPSTLPPPPSTPAVEAQERKQEHHSPQSQLYSHTQQLGVHQQAFPPSSQGIFQMKPPDFGRPPQGPPHGPVGQHHYHAPPQPNHSSLQSHHGRVPPPPPPYRTIPQSAMTQFHNRQAAPASGTAGGTHYNANIGQIGPPPSHFYNPMASSSSSSAVPSPVPITNPAAPSVADKRKDSFQSYDYDESIELITAGPNLDPNIPRDIIVKSSFNTASGAKPKSLSSGHQHAPAASPLPTVSSGLSGLWQGAVEKVSAFIGEGSSGSSYLQKQSSHPTFSSFGRALPNHFDKNAHLRQLQVHAAASTVELQASRGMRHMYDGVSSSSNSGDNTSSSSAKISSSRKFWGPGI